MNRSDHTGSPAYEIEHRLRVTRGSNILEGRVTAVFDGAIYLEINDSTEPRIRLAVTLNQWKTEFLPPPEPDWASTPGQVAIDSDDDIWRLESEGWHCVRLEEYPEYLTYVELLENWGPLTPLFPADKVEE